MKNLIAIAAFSAAATFASVASANSTQEQLSMCASALEEAGVASSTDYRSRFKGLRGGATKTLTLRMIAISEGKESFDAVCKIRRGEVIEAAAK
ncbi:MAG: hypothetical protein AAF850_04655 [Pseudomonadota bacterium]